MDQPFKRASWGCTLIKPHWHLRVSLRLEALWSVSVVLLTYPWTAGPPAWCPCRPQRTCTHTAGNTSGHGAPWSAPAGNHSIGRPRPAPLMHSEAGKQKVKPSQKSIYGNALLKGSVPKAARHLHKPFMTTDINLYRHLERLLPTIIGCHCTFWSEKT